MYLMFVIFCNQQVAGEECVSVCCRSVYCQRVQGVGSDVTSHTVN
jgi:hypothetical protein